MAAGFVAGEGDGDLRLPTDAPAPLDAIERAIIPALERPPCVVGFSGGRDSSAILALAVRAARREGLELPIPTTLRFRDAPAADESEWQEPVIRHLGLTEWDVRELGEETDWIGSLSTGVMRRHGMMFPANAFIQVPLLEAAASGSLLNGNGGDQLLVGWRRHFLADLRARRRRPEPRDLLRLGYVVSPRAVRRRVEIKRHLRTAPAWLRPEARLAAAELGVPEFADAPLRFDEWVRWLAPRREIAVGTWTLGVLARDSDVLVVQPFLDPGFLGAFARAGGAVGFGDRTAAMEALFSQLLPERTVTRSTKASGAEVYWREQSREFARTWDGTGVDHELVDAEVLQAEWMKPNPRAQSALPMQAAWFAGQSNQ